MNNDTVDLLQIKIEQAKEKLPVETVNAIAAVDWKAAIMELRLKKGYNFEQLGDLELETELLLCGLTSPTEYQKELQIRMKISKAETDKLVEEMNALVFSKIKAELIKNTERKRVFQKSTDPENPPVSPLIKGEGFASPDKGRSGGVGRLEGLNEITTPSRRPESEHSPFAGGEETVLQSAGIEVVKPELEARVAIPNAMPVIEKPAESREEILKKVENPTSSILQEKIFGSVQTPIIKTEHTLDNISAPVKTPLPKVDPYREIPE